jgi:hypothetical protein
MSKFIILFMTILVSAACGFFVGQQTKSLANSETSNPIENKKPDYLRILQEKNIERFQGWENGEGKKFLAVIHQLNELCDKDYILSSCEKLSIYDEFGNGVYELKDFGVSLPDYARLKSNSFQYIIETNGGGTDESLTIVDYKDEKFVELEIEDDTSLRGGWWTMPEYRSGVAGAYFKPSQLILIQQIGGGDNSPKASVFRHKENKIQKVGEIKMQELGDFIEKQIAKNR